MISQPSARRDAPRTERILFSRREGTIKLPESEYSSSSARLVGVSPIVIERGCITTIQGPSGSGKSFLLSILCRNFDDSGLDDEGKGLASTYCDAAHEPSQRKDIAGDNNDYGVLDHFIYIAQAPELRRELSVEDEAWRTWRSVGIAPEPGRDPLKLMGLSDHSDRKVGSLSGGQLKRFGIALRLCEGAECLVLDEPDAGLDKKTFEGLLFTLKNLPEQPAILMVTHHADWFTPDHRVCLTPVDVGSRQASESPRIHSFVGPALWTRVLGRVWHQVHLMWRGWLDLLVFFSPSILIAALITLATGDEVHAEVRFTTQCFFLIIAAAWLGLQFASREVFHSLGTWREDVQFLTRLLPTRNALSESMVIGVAFLIVAGSAGVLFGVGLSATFVLLNHGLFPSSLSGFMPLAAGTVSSAVYGSVLGAALAAVISAVSMHRWPMPRFRPLGTIWSARRLPNAIWLTMVIPMVMLIHIVVSSIFLRGQGFRESGFAEERTVIAALSRMFPTTWAAALAEEAPKFGKAGGIHVLSYVGELSRSMITSILPCLWITVVCFFFCFRTPEIRER